MDDPRELNGYTRMTVGSPFHLFDSFNPLWPI